MRGTADRHKRRPELVGQRGKEDVLSFVSFLCLPEQPLRLELLLETIRLFLQSRQHPIPSGEEALPFTVTKIARLEDSTARTVRADLVISCQDALYRPNDAAMNHESDGCHGGHHDGAQQGEADLKPTYRFDRLRLIDFRDDDPSQRRNERPNARDPGP